MPAKETLEELKANHFKGSEKDYSSYLNVLKALGCKKDTSILDYGCSWGYGSWQFERAGYKVTGFEISKPRCEYAKINLAINAFSDPEMIKGHFDIFFSSHVLEHVPSVSQSLSLARKLLKPGGIFIAFTPNGSNDFRITNPKVWNQLWGSVHPNFLDDTYYKNTFRSGNIFLDSNPYDSGLIEKYSNIGGKVISKNLSGPELLIISKF